MMPKKLNPLIVGLVMLISCNSKTKSTPKLDVASEVTAVAIPDFQISLAQWSLHNSFFGPKKKDHSKWFQRMIKESPDSLLQGKLDPMDFPMIAAGYGIKNIELVNTFYYSKARNKEYWKVFQQKCDQAGVQVGLIMCDHLGDLGDADEVVRTTAVKNHFQWVDVAKELGAHSIRVNAAGSGTAEEVAANAINGLSKLGAYGASKGINVIVENHGGYSSDGIWLSGVIQKVGMDNVGTLPDFGNFCIERGSDGCAKEYDRYKGMAELMPYAKGVSAKSKEFDENGSEVNSDFAKMMKIVKDSGFKGFVGIEYGGNQLSEDEGIKATRALLERVFAGL